MIDNVRNFSKYSVDCILINRQPSKLKNTYSSYVLASKLQCA